MNEDGSNRIEISSPAPVCDQSGQPKRRDREAEWAPDGSRILFVRGYQCEPEETLYGPHDIFLIDPDGSGVQKVLESPDWETHAHWSPSGAKIVYDGGDGSIHTVGADGSDHQAIGDSGAFPDWGP